MKFTLKSSLILVALFGCIIALLLTRIELIRTQSKLDDVQQLLPQCQVTVDLVFKTERTKSVRTLRYPGLEDDRSCLHSVGPTINSVAAPGLTFSAWFVGDVGLIAGDGRGRQETSGYLIAIQISKYDPETGEPSDIETKYVVYSGKEIEGFENGNISVTLRPSSD